ncbi:troponin T isoform X2 [Patella vulgata]|uniref:troponin T isoform X2 n=1 Tax=Patella vulgata TaxID=6465 RepID=UPI00217FC2D8|nr:troponin T isoform X2 [Patella vulgata]
MSDDESRDAEHAPVERQVESGDSNEAKKAMEEAERRKKERMAEELAEYEEMRRAEREKELEELEALRIKREERKAERIKEEAKQKELREIEDKRQRAEQEERKRKKLEEEQKKKEEREKKRKEAEARMAIAKGQRNFVITKREGEGVDLENLHQEEPMQKTREEIEEEKRNVLATRIQPLNIENANQQVLTEKAKALHAKLRQLEGDKYDLEQRYKRQQYDLIELAERSRQMNKGKSKRSAVQVDESFDRLSDKYTSAPPKILLCSKYERLTDRRTFGERATLFEELCKEPPPPEIKRVRPAGGGGDEEGEEGEEE